LLGGDLPATELMFRMPEPDCLFRGLLFPIFIPF
jgi:hypothetical protein